MNQVTSRRRRLRRLLGIAVPLLAFATVLWLKPMGLLMWARLRILTNIPRTAIADPPAGFPDRSSSAKVESPTDRTGEAADGAKSDRERDEEPSTS